MLSSVEAGVSMPGAAFEIMLASRRHAHPRCVRAWHPAPVVHADGTWQDAFNYGDEIDRRTRLAQTFHSSSRATSSEGLAIRREKSIPLGSNWRLFREQHRYRRES